MFVIILFLYFVDVDIDIKDADYYKFIFFIVYEFVMSIGETGAGCHSFYLAIFRKKWM